MKDPRAWFGTKRIGIGYSPRTWEGWLLIGALVVVAIVLKHHLL